MELTLETKSKTISIMEKIQVKLISLVYKWPGVNIIIVFSFGDFLTRWYIMYLAINFMLSKSN